MASCPLGRIPYTIRSGDTLWLISQRYYTSTSAIMAANPGLKPNNLQVGQTICIPSRRAPRPPVPTPPSGGGPSRCPVGLRTYTIQRNDTLWQIAQRYCTTVDSIMTLNPGLNPNNLKVGQTIWIPAGYRLPNLPIWFRSQAVVPEASDNGDEVPLCPGNTDTYVIESGDTLWTLSQRFQTTPEEIMAINQGINPTNLFVGQVLCIPRRRNNVPQPPIPQPAPQPMPMPQPMPQPVPLPTPMPEPEPPIFLWVSKEEQNLNNYLRLLWAQHAYWARIAMQGMILDSPDVPSDANRLMQNPKDFEIALQTFYGNNVAANFAELLNQHIALTNEFLMAAKEDRSAAAADAEKRWNENADQIADFLGNINPNWSAEEWKQLLYDHIVLLKNDICNMLSGNFDDSIGTFTDVESGVLEMADIMTLGIVKQYPQYFR